MSVHKQSEGILETFFSRSIDENMAGMYGLSREAVRVKVKVSLAAKIQ